VFFFFFLDGRMMAHYTQEASGEFMGNII